MNGLEDLSYDRRLSVLGLQSLTQHLQYNDLVLTYKIMHAQSIGSYLRIGWSTPVTRSEGLRFVHYKPKSHLYLSAFNQEFPLCGTVYLLLLSRVQNWEHST